MAKKLGYFARKKLAKKRRMNEVNKMDRTAEGQDIKGLTYKQKEKVIKKEVKNKFKNMQADSDFKKRAIKKYGANYEKVHDKIMEAEVEINKQKKLSQIRTNEMASKAFTAAGAFASGIGSTASSLSNAVEDLFTADSDETKYAWQF